ncbi:hypothetical protein M2108_005044, partial [Paenibacillus sp. PastM-3]|nr:hypothetical protein [Paenibacillus sp. PastF-2]MDH6510059.1 hypothetical protein [Paenibacillus sp. PastM-3]
AACLRKYRRYREQLTQDWEQVPDDGRIAS